MTETTLQGFSDYALPLLTLMGELGSAKASEVRSAFQQRYGELIPAAHLEQNSKGSQKWEATIHWLRYTLTQVELLVIARDGRWAITDKGRQWLREHGADGREALQVLLAEARRRGAEVPRKRTARPARRQSKRSNSSSAARVSSQGPAGQNGSLESASDYALALIKLMDDIGQGRAVDVCARFEERYRGIISADHRRIYERSRTKWETKVRWANSYLTQAGLMHSPEYGVWAITATGQAWLREHSDQAANAMQQLLQTARRGKGETQQPPAPRNAVTLSPAASTGVGDRRAHDILDRQIGQIRQFLQGRIERPSDEVLCEWVQFCYLFEFFAEGQRIFDLINEGSVDMWPYQRAKRQARVCRLRATA